MLDANRVVLCIVNAWCTCACLRNADMVENVPRQQQRTQKSTMANIESPTVMPSMAVTSKLLPASLPVRDLRHLSDNTKHILHVWPLLDSRMWTSRYMLWKEDRGTELGAQ